MGPHRQYDRYVERFNEEHADSVEPETLTLAWEARRDWAADATKLDWNENYNQFSNSAKYINDQWQSDAFWQLGDGRVAVQFYRVRGSTWLIRIWDNLEQARAFAVPMPRNIWING